MLKRIVKYMNNLINLLRKELVSAIENIDCGNSNLTEEEMSELIDMLSQINKGKATVSKAYACEHILHINQNKFDYLVRQEIIPKGRKRLGFHELSWTIKDFDAAIEYLKRQ